MAHYAILDENNTVVNVIVGVDENDLDNLPSGFDDWEAFYSSQLGKNVKRTSFNTRNGIYTTVDEDDEIIAAPDDEQSKAFRGNFAEIGGTYDNSNDRFMPIKPYASWVVDETSLTWKPPVDKPDDYELVPYMWDEDTTSWIEVPEDQDHHGNHYG